ncbi:MAG: galactokinase [Bacillota bacterium]
MTNNELISKFIEVFGGTPTNLRAFAAPGRVNLIGEHTDYNGGFVFPAALSVGTTIVARKRDDSLIRMAVTDLPDFVEVDFEAYDILDEYKDLHWGSYQVGVAKELVKEGYAISGCDLLYHDTVPHGGGLSSSAAIEIATAVALTALASSDENAKVLDSVDAARISQMAEHNFIGVKCGIMDQFASSMGKKDHAIFLNCKDLSFEYVPIVLDGYKIVVSNTKVKRSLATSKYNERRAECESGLKILKTKLDEITCLGDLSIEAFNLYKFSIEDKIVRKRCEHVVCEDDRVLRSIKALHDGDLVEFGALMNASHDSLRDLYEVTGIELDTMVSEARRIDGVLGSRMTGAGFGGCTVSIVADDSVEKFIAQVGSNYFKITGILPEFYVSEIGDGGREVSLEDAF